MDWIRGKMLIHGGGDLAIGETVVDHDVPRLFPVQLILSRLNKSTLLPILIMAFADGTLNLAGEQHYAETFN
jgi:hypothetical protein